MGRGWKRAAEYRQSLTRQTDLGSLKGTLRLDQLTCKMPAMVDKEVQIAMLSYNLVRAVIYQAAQQAGVAPRSFSFTRVKRILKVYGGLWSQNCRRYDRRGSRRLFALMNHAIGQAKLYPRKKKCPTYPREILAQREAFPRRKAQS